MTAVVKEVYDAFRKAGVPDNEAWDAAAALSTHEARFAELRTEIDGFRRDVDRRFDDADRRLGGLEQGLAAVRRDVAEVKRDVAEVKRDVAGLQVELRMFRWMLGFIVALNIGILVRLLTM
jgi:hypothetical protein